MKAIRPLILAAACLAAAPGALAQATPKPKVYALVSAVGSDISLVRQRQQVGSNREPYQRLTLPVPDASVDVAVLRGLDRAVAKDDPASRRIYMRLSPAEVRGVLPYKRGDAIVGKLATILDRMPERKDWDRVILVTPRYVNGSREQLGTRLHGIGIFVQPLERNAYWRSETSADFLPRFDPDTVSTRGEASRANRFVAPYFNAQVWVLDARTLEVIDTRELYDFERIHDADSSALDIDAAFPPEKLAEVVVRFVEDASARSLEAR